MTGSASSPPPADRDLLQMLAQVLLELPAGVDITRVVADGAFVVRIELNRGGHLIGFMALQETW